MCCVTRAVTYVCTCRWMWQALRCSLPPFWPSNESKWPACLSGITKRRELGNTLDGAGLSLSPSLTNGIRHSRRRAKAEGSWCSKKLELGLRFCRRLDSIIRRHHLGYSACLADLACFMGRKLLQPDQGGQLRVRSCSVWWQPW